MTDERDGNGFAVVAGVITFKGFFVGDLAASHLPPSMQDEVEHILNGERPDERERAEIRRVAYQEGRADGLWEALHEDPE